MKLYSRVVEDMTGHHHIEVEVDAREGNWPAMVTIEAEGGTVLAEDARSYALALLAAADVAEQANETAEPPSIDLISGVIGDDFRRRADG